MPRLQLMTPRYQLIILSVFLLSACEGMVTVDIQGDAPSPDGELTLAVTDIEFVHSDGSTESFSLDESLTFDEDGLQLTRLIDGEDLREGYYSQINIVIDADESEYDFDGGSSSNALGISGGTITATADNRRFRIRDSETESLVLHLSPFLALPTAEDDDEEQSLEPSMTVTRSAYGYSLSVTLGGDNAFSSNCSDTDNQLPRLYLFDTADSDKDNDVNGDSDDPLRVVFAETSTSSNITRLWSLPNLPEGNYRLALSCDDDDPSQDDDILFFCQSAVEITTSTSISLDSESTDSSCN